MNPKYTQVNAAYHEIWKSDKLAKLEKEYPPEYKEYRRKWEENPKKQIVGEFPLHVDLESTRRCNLRCPMCIRTIKMERGETLEEGDMDFKLYKKVVDEGSENGLCAIKLNYLGEPLLHEDLPGMVKYAKKRGILEVMINTNGTLLTEELSRRLIDAGLDKILLSFDSPTKERYESIRVGASFEQVINNFRTLIRLRDEANLRKPVLRVNMVKMKENEVEVPRFVELWKPIADLIAIQDYINPQLKDCVGRGVIGLKKHPNFVCPQIYQRLAVHYDGKIGMCCFDFDAEMRLGNAWNTNIKDVWLGERMQEVRRLHNEGKWQEIPPCARCTMPYV